MHSQLTRASSLSEEIKHHKETKNLLALVSIRDGMSETILSVRERAKQATNNALKDTYKRNLAVAERNFSLVQETIDSIH